VRLSYSANSGYFLLYQYKQYASKTKFSAKNIARKIAATSYTPETIRPTSTILDRK
jgi:hypothetical protein